MSTTHSGSFQLTDSATLATGYGSLQPTISVNKPQTDGTGNNAFDMVYVADLVVTNSGTPKDIDLYNSLLQPDQAAFNAAKVISVTIVNSDSIAILSIGGSPTNPFIDWLMASGDGVKLHPSGTFHIDSPLNGYTVTNNSADVLRVATNTGSNVAFSIMIKARSA